MRRSVVVGITVVLGAIAVAVAVGAAGHRASAASEGHLTPLQRRLVSGFLSRALDQRAGPVASPTQGAQQPLAAPAAPATTPNGCATNHGSNVQLNQGCQNLSDPDLAGRGQAQNELAIAQNPSDASQIVASSNDYRRGDGNCYTYYSSDGGRTWQDSTPPMGFTRGDAFGGFARQYWQAGGDTSVAWDTKGNAYLSCQMFKRGQPVSNDVDQSSAFYVFRSTGTRGASWNFPARPVAELDDTAGKGDQLLDKQYLTADNHVGSPFQDRLYVTWTLFASDGTAYIYEAYSRDYGESFSAPKLVSAASDACVNDLGAPTPQGPCNANQFSQPFTGPDGALYVVWDNYNVTAPGAPHPDVAPAPGPSDNRAQILLARSTDGGNTFSAPIKVADFYDLPDCATYQGGADAGVACVPEKGETTNSIFRAANYPSGAVNPNDPSEVDVAFGSYINRHSNERNGCVPDGYNADTFLPRYEGVKTVGACNNDILLSRSTDGGKSFTGTAGDVRTLPATRAFDLRRADQFWPWATFSDKGRFVVSYYDRAYGNDETSGFSDVSLSATTNGRDFATTRVTTGSMPPPSQFSGAFWGDYTGLSVAGTTAHPAWMDTRDPELFTCRDSAGNVVQPPAVCQASAPNATVANDQNAYSDGVRVP